MLGGRIASGPGSGVKFILQDHSVVIIGPNSTVSVDQFAADRRVLRLERGSFYVHSANPGVVHIVLPAGTVAVRTDTVACRNVPEYRKGGEAVKSGLVWLSSGGLAYLKKKIIGQ